MNNHHHHPRPMARVETSPDRRNLLAKGGGLRGVTKGATEALKQSRELVAQVGGGKVGSRAREFEPSHRSCTHLLPETLLMQTKKTGRWI